MNDVTRCGMKAKQQRTGICLFTVHVRPGGQAGLVLKFQKKEADLIKE